MLAESKSPSCLCLPQPEPWEPDSHGGPAKSTLTPATRCWNRHFLLFPKTFGTEIFNLLHSRNRNYGKGGIQTSPKAEAAPTEHTGISQGNFYFLQSLWPQDPSSDNHAELRIKKSHRRVGWVWATSCRYGVSKRATLNHCERNFPNKELSDRFLKTPPDPGSGVKEQRPLCLTLTLPLIPGTSKTPAGAGVC